MKKISLFYERLIFFMKGYFAQISNQNLTEAPNKKLVPACGYRKFS